METLAKWRDDSGRTVEAAVERWVVDHVERDRILTLAATDILGVTLRFDEVGLWVHCRASTFRGVGDEYVDGNFYVRYSNVLQQLSTETLLQVFSKEISRRTGAPVTECALSEKRGSRGTRIDATLQRWKGAHGFEIETYGKLELTGSGLEVLILRFHDSVLQVVAYAGTLRGMGVELAGGSFSIGYSDVLQQLPTETLLGVVSEEFSRRIAARKINATPD